MTDNMIRLITAVVLLAHGLGHLMGILAGLGIKLSENHSLNSRLLTVWFGEQVTTIIGMIISGTTFALFGLSGVALMNWGISASYWPGLAITAAIISLAGLLIYWNSFPFFIPNKVGAFVVDLVVLISILRFNWPREMFF